MAEQSSELMFTEEVQSGSPPWSVDVDVFLDAVGPPPQFRIESYLQAVAHGDLVFHNRGRPGFTVSFHLHDKTNGGYVFPSNAADAVWSQQGNACPTTGIWNVFEPISVTPDGLTLVVQNDNPAPPTGPIGKFQYTLNLTNGTNSIAIDPGGNNQNGGTG